MGKFIRWLKINVLRKEKLDFTVYFNYRGSNGEELILPLMVESRSKIEAKEKAKKYIRENAIPGRHYRFLKVVHSGRKPLRYKED